MFGYGMFALWILMSIILLKPSPSLKYKFKYGFKRFFKKSGLYLTKGDKSIILPHYSHMELGEEGTYVYFDVPEGLGLKEFRNCKEAMEMYIGYKVDMDRVDSKLRLRVRSNELPNVIDYDISLIRQIVKKRGYKLPVLLGIDGDTIIGFDLADSPPHLSIGGTTGGGKSNLLRVIITTLVSVCTPKELEMVFIDYKDGVEAMTYEGLPHMKAIATDTDTTLSLLKSVVKQMTGRYNFIKKYRCLSVNDYNRIAFKKISHLVIIIDEMGDMNPEEAPKVYEKKGDPPSEKTKRVMIQSYLSQIARKGRAAGIHLIPASQRMDGYVMPKQIQQNISGRVAFHCSEEYSSESSLGQGCLDACDIPADIPGRGIFKYQDKIDFQSFYLDSKVCEDVLLRYAGLHLDLDSDSNRDKEVDSLNDIFNLKL